MQAQNQLPARIQIVAPVAIKAGQLVEVGDRVGWANDDADAGEAVTVHLCVLQDGTNMSDGTAQVYAAETWAQGDTLYYNRLSGLVGKDPTDWRIGSAYEAKAANQTQCAVYADDGRRDGDRVFITIDFSKTENAALGAVGDLVLLTGPAVVRSGQLYGSGLTSGSGNNAATVSVGDAGGTKAELLAATTLGNLAAKALASNIAITTALVISIGVEAIDGGVLQLVAERL